jgi:hypothetical protein
MLQVRPVCLQLARGWRLVAAGRRVSQGQSALAAQQLAQTYHRSLFENS